MTAVGTDVNNPINVIIGDEEDELIRGQGTGAFAGFGGDDTLVSALNPAAPGSTLFGNTGDDYIESRGIGDSAFGGKNDDTISNDSGQAYQSGDLGDDVIYTEEGGATLVGGDGDDSLRAEEAENVFDGGAGNDTMVGGEGNDLFAGGEGNDSIVGGPEGNNIMLGNEGEDELTSTTTDDDADAMFGGKGNDEITVAGSSTADSPTLSGDLGDDELTVAGSGVDGALLIGDGENAGTDAGADTLSVAGGNEHTLTGNGGDDSLNVAGAGSDIQMFGGDGDDSLTGTAGDDLLAYGDLGDDYLNITANGAQLWGDNPDDSLNLGADTVIGVGVQNTLAGDNDNAGSSGGDDYLMTMGEPGVAGSNLLLGFAGDDTLFAGTGDINLGETLIGGEGNDLYLFGQDDFIPQDTLGINTYIGNGAGSSVTVTVQPQDSIAGDATFFIPGDNSNVRSIAEGGLITGDAADLLTIGSASGVTDSGGGNDTLNLGPDAASGDISAGAGNDVINSTGTDGITGSVDLGAGDDTLTAESVSGSASGSAGNDLFDVETLSGGLNGDAGNDTLDVGTALGGASANGGEGADSVVAGALGTTDGAVTFTGGGGNDTLGLAGTTPAAAGGTTDSETRLILDGGAGNDFLQGGAFRDSLSGGPGDDILFGGFGDPLNAGPSGASVGTTGSAAAAESQEHFYDGDELVGGAGVDRFLFTSPNQTGSIAAGYDAGSLGTGLEGFADGLVISPEGEFINSTGSTGAEGSTGYLNPVLNVDTLTGFAVGQDRIILDADAFGEDVGTALVSTFSYGTLIANFDQGSNYAAAFPNNFAGTGNSNFYYDSQSGGLYFDFDDGSTGTGVFLVAVLPENLTLDNNTTIEFANVASGIASTGFELL